MPRLLHLHQGSQGPQPCHWWCPATMRLHPGSHTGSRCVFAHGGDRGWRESALQPLTGSPPNSASIERTLVRPRNPRVSFRDPACLPWEWRATARAPPREGHVRVSAPRWPISFKPRFRTPVSMYYGRFRAGWQLVRTLGPGNGTEKRHLRSDRDPKFRKRSKTTLEVPKTTLVDGSSLK